MIIIHVTESHEATAGGISTVVDQLARHIRRPGLTKHILSVGRDPIRAPPGVELTNIQPSFLLRRWRWSPRLKETIAGLGLRSPGTLLHIHGVWLAAQWYGARAARRNEVPFVVSMHGQLEPYHWRDKGPLQFAKKELYWHLMARPVFRCADVVHAITPLEKEHLAQLLPNQRIEVIPNAVDLDEVDGTLTALPAQRESRRTPTIAFLGRFHPKKGVHLLIQAFGMTGLPSEWQLLLAGPAGEARYMRALKHLIERSRKRDRIKLLGPLLDGKKWEFYQSATVVAVPSLSEVVGLVNLEAAACGTPTITTHATGLYDWEDGGGILINPNVHELTEALLKMCSLGAAEYEVRSAASRRLVEERYSWSVVGPRWSALYDSLLEEEA